MKQCVDDPYEDYYNTATNTPTQDEFMKWQQQEIYQRNNPERLPDLKPLANEQDARGVVRESDSTNGVSGNSKKRQR